VKAALRSFAHANAIRNADGVSLLAKFDGEFANRLQTYSGTGRIRYTW
jgi:hypothetical protein